MCVVKIGTVKIGGEAGVPISIQAWHEILIFSAMKESDQAVARREGELDTIQPQSRAEWRTWLQENHATKSSIWLVYSKKIANTPSVAYSDAVDEALCFGWIDSKAKPIDALRYMQFFCPRKPNSVWSRINKAKIERLIAAGLMTDAGLAVIERAKANGSWTILDAAEDLIVPADLDAALLAQGDAKAYFTGLSRSDQRNILQWLVLAKRAETRQKRITEIAELASQKLKPKQFR